MARFDGSEVGGRSVDTVQWEFTGDQDTAMHYIGRARVLIGELQQRMSFQKVTTSTHVESLRTDPPGGYIQILITIGLIKAEIYIPFKKGKRRWELQLKAVYWHVSPVLGEPGPAVDPLYSMNWGVPALVVTEPNGTPGNEFCWAETRALSEMTFWTTDAYAWGSHNFGIYPPEYSSTKIKQYHTGYDGSHMVKVIGWTADNGQDLKGTTVGSTSTGLHAYNCMTYDHLNKEFSFGERTTYATVRLAPYHEDNGVPAMGFTPPLPPFVVSSYFTGETLENSTTDTNKFLDGWYMAGIHAYGNPAGTQGVRNGIRYDIPLVVTLVFEFDGGLYWYKEFTFTPDESRSVYDGAAEGAAAHWLSNEMLAVNPKTQEVAFFSKCSSADTGWFDVWNNPEDVPMPKYPENLEPTYIDTIAYDFVVEANGEWYFEEHRVAKANK